MPHSLHDMESDLDRRQHVIRVPIKEFLNLPAIMHPEHMLGTQKGGNVISQ